MNLIPQDKNRRWLTISVWGIIAIGSFLRIAMLLQNRNLFIDEANIARNVYERTFAGLALPLSYEQYAPPVFLWILKLHTTVLGFSEYAFRLYPLLTGIFAMYLFTNIMKLMNVAAGVLYPLFLMATGFIYIHFSTEVKQYMPDTCIALLLVWL
jgi:predicted membrane-bound mannosyltransferase